MTLANRLSQYKSEGLRDKPTVAGKLTRVVGLTLETTGCRAPLGSLCEVETINGSLQAEVVGFAQDKLFLMPSDQLTGVLPGARVTPLGHSYGVPVGPALLGRVIDGLGKPLDGLGPIHSKKTIDFNAPPINPMSRQPIRQPMDVGVRAINSVLTVGQGQRMGLFAGSGVGKSVLLGMMCRGTTADVVVVGLIGERGREVKEFIDDILGVEDRQRAVVVAAPADASPLMRLKACDTTMAIAEHFRDQGKNVLLMMDSLTRYAQAQREVALAIGEPPATKGYPPSVFAKLPRLVERAGNGPEGTGSVTAFFTVLTEGDDLQDPIADASRAILDGHIVLSRNLADAGHYPAIDIEKSISRVMPAVTEDAHQQLARGLKMLYSSYEQNQDLIAIGAYQRGADPKIDLAITMKPQMDQFLQQGMKEIVNYDDSLARMERTMQMANMNLQQQAG